MYTYIYIAYCVLTIEYCLLPVACCLLQCKLWRSEAGEGSAAGARSAPGAALAATTKSLAPKMDQSNTADSSATAPMD